MKHISSFILLSFFSLTVFAQDPCDDLNFLSIKYSPFTDTVVIVHVENNSAELFDYPGFVLINNNGDTVAKERTDFFGIGQESVHRLNVREGVQDPSENFDGNLELHTGFYDVLACSWNLDQPLCVDGSCDSLFVGLENYGGALVTGDFEWSVQDDMGYVAESGQFTMVAEIQSWQYGLCLAPGNYTYTLNALTQASGGGPTLTVSNSRSYATPTMSAPLDWFNDPSGEVEFPFFTFCTESPNSISNSNSDSDLPVIVFNHQTNQLVCAEPMSEIKIYSTAGPLVASVSQTDRIVAVPAGLSSGTYIAVASTSKGEIRSKFVLN